MKQINTYINEKLRLTNKRTYTCQPKDKDELRDIILQRITDEGNECDLNDIDVSKITDMSNLFVKADYNGNLLFKDFNADISMWDVSNVENMDYMFYRCKKFNCDISKWNVSKVMTMYCMFYNCKEFNQDLNKWDASHASEMTYAFAGCPTCPKWYDKDKWEEDF